MIRINAKSVKTKKKERACSDSILNCTTGMNTFIYEQIFKKKRFSNQFPYYEIMQTVHSQPFQLTSCTKALYSH